MTAATQRFRELVRARLGLHFDDHKIGELTDVLLARMSALGVHGLDAYIARLDDVEIGAIAERLTVGETYFFRYREQFDALREAVLPELHASARRPLRVLSAGCATGEEAYSLAIAARERDASAFDVVAFDVNPAAIERARRGRYSAWSLRETPPAIRDRYFTTERGAYALAESVRNSVRFERRNLLDEDASFWRAGAFDLVFCRNVIMYFDADTMRSVIDRISRAIAPGGFLFLGHAETLRGISTSFALCHTHETFYYRRKPGPVLAMNARAHDEPAPAPPPLATGDASWIEVIQRASDRVTELASSTPATRARAAPTTPRDNAPALEMMRGERFAEALAWIGTPDANDPEAQLLHAALLTIRGDLREAERTCSELLARDELSAGAHYLKALCREHAGDDAGAREHDRIASYLDAGFAMPHVHLGLLERRAGHFDAAIQELRVALELLGTEDASRILLFGGGFGREALAALCRSEIKRCEAGR